MPTRRPALSVLIASYNARDVLRACLQALRASEAAPPFEVVVYDNASHDGSPDMVAHEFPEAVLVRGAENLGFARANNRMAERAAGEALLLLNSDAFVSSDALRLLWQAAESRPTWSLIAPQLLEEDGTPQASIRTPPTLRRLAAEALGFGRFEEIGLPAAGGALPPGVYASGAALLVRREAWERLGGFDEAFFFYGEDADLARRALQAGLRLHWLPSVRITHLGGASTAADRPAAAVEGYRAAFLYIARHQGRAALCLARVAVALGAAARWLVTALVPSPRERRAARLTSYARVVRLCFRRAVSPTGRFGDV